jgi:ABC-type nitrate/sulfonate/bicarbonate transport system ATPase subunit
LENELATFSKLNQGHIGMVSENVPLVSNLDVWINIALIKQYHENLPDQVAFEEVMSYLTRYQLDQIAHKRNPSLTPEQRFRVMLLRASMVVDAIIVIDRPFNLLPALQDSGFIDESLHVIADLYKTSCVFDYLWFKDRYRMSDVA